MLTIKRRYTMDKKGQAAMEFLMTYGWAILAAIIAIGVLAYFGVFSPGKYVTGSAVVNPPFYANAWNVQAGNGINIELRNNGGEQYTVTNVAVLSSTTGVDCSTTTLTMVPSTGIVLPSKTISLNIAGCTGLEEGKTFKGDVTITYNKLDSNLALTSTGTIAEKITA